MDRRKIETEGIISRFVTLLAITNVCSAQCIQTLNREPVQCQEIIYLYVYVNEGIGIARLQLSLNNANDTSRCVKLIDITKNLKLQNQLKERALSREDIRLIYCGKKEEANDSKQGTIGVITESICKPSHIVFVSDKHIDYVCTHLFLKILFSLALLYYTGRHKWG